MFDLVNNTQLGDVLTKAYAAGRCVAAVCHGPAGLLLAREGDGKSLVAGKKVTGFTLEEEQAVGKADKVRAAGAVGCG